MDEKALFAGAIDTAVKSLDLRSRRHDLIVSNLANADTPGYKAFDLMVDEAMAEQGKGHKGVELQRTHSGHFTSVPGVGHGISPRMIQYEEMNNLRGDGNTVDMDREMAGLAENQLMYRASVKIIGQKFQGLKNVIQGGKR